MAAPIHRGRKHAAVLDGVEALTLVSDRSFPRHAHDQFGVGVLLFGAHRSWSGMGAVEAFAGDVIMVNPGEVHDGAPLGGGARGWRILYVDPLRVAREVAEEGAGPPGLLRPVVRDAPLAVELARLFETLAGSVQLACEERLVRILVRTLARHAVARPVLAHRRGVAVARARLDDAPGAPATLGELAALAGMTRFQLLRAFARELGITPHAYLVQRRVRRARELIVAGEPLAQAAAKAGFADQSHMTRAFVRQLGITPGRYRAS